MSDNRVTRGKFVEVTYTIVDGRDEVVEAASLPIHYIHGHNSGIFPEIERALEGKTPGDTVSVLIKDGFGPHDPNLTFTDAIDNVPPEFRRVGAEVQMEGESGEVKTFYVTKIEGGFLTVDGNHPFAGKSVTFHVNVETVRDATPVEITQAHAAREQNPGGGSLH
ncbi:FKBP-type peptidyl-prolyl cis-trans isomerase [Endothiovibrio diazotrophicus]